jgi:5-methylcytosine-specific restriction protein A
VTPLHVSGPTDTRLQDLATLCANCHRMIHRGSDWLRSIDLRGLVHARRAELAGSPATVDGRAAG